MLDSFLPLVFNMIIFLYFLIEKVIALIFKSPISLVIKNNTLLIFIQISFISISFFQKFNALRSRLNLVIILKFLINQCCPSIFFHYLLHIVILVKNSVFTHSIIEKKVFSCLKVILVLFVKLSLLNKFLLFYLHFKFFLKVQVFEKSNWMA